MARRITRIPVPVSDELRQIAKIERRSIAQQAGVAIDQYIQRWRSVLPERDKAMENRDGK
jgi:hypothetical protein